MANNFVKKMANSPFSSVWHSETQWDIATSMCKNFVNFGPVTAELTKLICERLVRHGQKTGVFSRITLDILDQFSQAFHRMKALWLSGYRDFRSQNLGSCIILANAAIQA